MMIENDVTRKGVCQKEIEANTGMVTTNSVLCDRTDCPSYGKWYCPFTGW